MTDAAEPLTPTEERLLRLLSDGQPHNRVELRRCLASGDPEFATVRFHLRNLRRKLPPSHILICELHRSWLCYRLIPAPAP